MSIGIEALMWGLISAISLPLGSILGLWWRPKQKINSAFMAFGAGALLFALSIELFAHVPHHVKDHGLWVLLASIGGAISGGLLFDGLNSMLNNRGAFIRKLSSAKSYLNKIYMLRAKKLINELGRIEVLRSLPAEIMSKLVTNVKRQKFNAGEKIFSQGDKGDCLYFILAGQVKVIRHDSDGDKNIAILKEQDTFGELGVFSDGARSADVVAETPVHLLKILKHDLDELLKESPGLVQNFQKLVKERITDLDKKSEIPLNNEWHKNCLDHLEHISQTVTLVKVREEISGGAAAGGAAMAIWLGILLDGIPESLVIGMLVKSIEGVSLAFIAGVFLANLPEAMSSSVSMRTGGMSIKKIMLMWWSICIMTGVGAFIGGSLFPTEPSGLMFYFVLFIEALAAGAMLTMIAETMLPEAFEHGGTIVGLSTLLGFLAALVVKVL